MPGPGHALEAAQWCYKQHHPPTKATFRLVFPHFVLLGTVVESFCTNIMPCGSQVLKAPVMHGKTIIFSAEPDAFKPITEDSPGVESQQLKCTRGVVHTSGKIK
jgi:hypothetical protein